MCAHPFRARRQVTASAWSSISPIPGLLFFLSLEETHSQVFDDKLG